MKRASITALGAVRVTVSTRLPRAALAAIVGAGVLVTLQSPVALAAGAPTYTVTATIPVGSDPDAVAVDPAGFSACCPLVGLCSCSVGRRPCRRV